MPMRSFTKTNSSGTNGIAPHDETAPHERKPVEMNDAREAGRPTMHENVPLLEVTDSHLLDLLYADPAASQCLLARLSPTATLVAPGKFDALVMRLRKLGHFPKVLG